MKEELIICTVAILLIMGHLGGAFIVSLTPPAGDPVQLPDDEAARHPVEHHEPGRDRHQRRHPGRPGRRDDRERRAPPLAPVRRPPGHGRHHRDHHPRLPDRGPADLLLGADHPAVVPAGVRPLGPRGEDVPSPGLHQDLRADRRGGPGHHARPRPDPDLHEGADQVGGRELARPDDDRHLQADALVADGPADPGLLALRLHPGDGLPRLDPPGPRVHARPGRGELPRDADQRAAHVGDPGGAGPEDARRRAPLVPRGPLRRRQGRPRRDRHRPLAARHDRDDHQPPRPRRLAEAEAPLRRRRASDPGGPGVPGGERVPEGRVPLRSGKPGQRRGHAGVEPGGRHAPRPGPAPPQRVPPRPRPPTRRRGGRLPPRSRRLAAGPSRRSGPPSGKNCSRRSPRRTATGSPSSPGSTT